jgi:hypothetical protein
LPIGLPSRSEPAGQGGDIQIAMAIGHECVFHGGHEPAHRQLKLLRFRRF